MTTSERGGPVFRGWAVVLAVFVMLTVSAGLVFYGQSVYLKALADRGLGVGGSSLATGVFFVTTGVSGVLIARLVDRYDPRVVVTGGALLAAVGLLLLGRVGELWQALAVYVVLGTGFAASSLVPGTTLVTRWFVRRRALALSIASTGLSLGGVLVTPYVNSVVVRSGLAEVAPELAAAYLVGVVPITLLLLRSSPQALGLQPDGDPAPPPPAAGAPAAVPGPTYAEAVRERRFHAITAAHLLAMLAQVGGLAHLVSLVTDSLDSAAAGVALQLVALMSLLGRLAGGVVMHRLPLVPCYAVLAVAQAAALLVAGLTGQRVVLLLAVVAFGITVGNLLMLHPLLLAEAYGVRDYARLYSRSNLVATLGIAGGPAVMGLVHDLTGSYGPAFGVAAAASLVAVPVLLVGTRTAAPVGPPVHTR